MPVQIAPLACSMGLGAAVRSASDLALHKTDVLGCAVDFLPLLVLLFARGFTVSLDLFRKCLNGFAGTAGEVRHCDKVADDSGGQNPGLNPQNSAGVVSHGVSFSAEKKKRSNQDINSP